MRALAFTVSMLLAFLLFSVQPMATKMVLPALGGAPAVWNTAMLTFQLLLLAGYGYAHLLTTRFAAGKQWTIHAAVIAASFAFLPLQVVLTSDDALLHQPIRHLVWAFLTQVGLPFFVLSATAPLLQSWVARSQHPLSQSPYVLYSASNLGSMAGLLGYVALIEPNFTLTMQSQGWSVLFVIGAALLLFTGRRLKPDNTPAEQSHATASEGDWPTILLWVWLAFLPSSVSLAVTSYITTDVAAVPLLWVVPLALYLLSFVEAFRTRPLFIGPAKAIAPAMAAMGLILYGFGAHRYSQMFPIQIFIFTVLAFALHGWLAAARPVPAKLTQFYLCLSIGGALGGAFNALAAPLLFTETLEYPLSLLAAGITALALWAKHLRMEWKAQAQMGYRVLRCMIPASIVLYVIGTAMDTSERSHMANLSMAVCFGAMMVVLIFRRYVPACLAGLVVGATLLVANITHQGSAMLFKERSFFGVWKVFDKPEENARFLMHNTTIHSAQYLKQIGKPSTLSYYTPLREVVRSLPTLRHHPMALMGLGAGTVKCLLQPGQHMDMFEIDPMVVRLAEDKAMFRYLSACDGTHHVYLGDGRIMLARQPDDRYGAIIMDAFSSDSVPAHLVTTQALSTYTQKLAKGGVLLLHTTNRHLNLWPLMAAQAKALGYVAYAKHFPADPALNSLIYTSFWVVMARDAQDIAPLLEKTDGWQKLNAEEQYRPWTDSYVNILPYLRMLRTE